MEVGFALDQGPRAKSSRQKSNNC